MGESNGYVLSVNPETKRLYLGKPRIPSLWKNDNWSFHHVDTERTLAPATEGEVNLETKISSTENLGVFTWGYEDGFLFPTKSKEFVLEIAGNNNGPFKLRRRTGKANQKWRILYEYIDEDAE